MTSGQNLTILTSTVMSIVIVPLTYGTLQVLFREVVKRVLVLTSFHIISVERRFPRRHRS